MKKKFFSIVLILIGAGMWIALSNTASYSIKKWDAKFETVLRDSLSSAGLTNLDLLSSVHEVNKDKSGEWITHHVTVRLPSQDKRQDIKKTLEGAGARIEELKEGSDTIYLVKRGSRTYQMIQFAHP